MALPTLDAPMSRCVHMHEGTHPVAGQLPKEFYVDCGPGGPTEVERVCAQATNRSVDDVVAVAVANRNVAQAADLLFGTGIGIVSSINETGTTLINLARRSAAEGATEVALPPMVLDQPAVLTRLRSHLGAATPVTIGLDDTDGRLDLAAAESALRLGADYVSYTPRSISPWVNHDVAALLALATGLQLGGVKITRTTRPDEMWTLPDLAAPTTRLRVPVSATGDLRPYNQ